MNIKKKKEELIDLKKEVLTQYKYRIKCKSCSNEILELQKKFEIDKNWSLVSHSYYYDTRTLEVINETYIYFNKDINKATEFVFSNNKHFAYFRYLKNREFEKYDIPKQIVKK